MKLPWGSFFHPTDSRGRESRTLWFVTLSWLVITIRFAFGGLSFDAGPAHWTIDSAAIVDYGAAVAAILAIWIGREWVCGRKTPDRPASQDGLGDK